MRILLADDQSRVRSAIRLLLEQQPEANIVEEVTTAQELLERVGNCCPDMLLLDWDLPGSTPEKLLATLRTLCPGLFITVLNSRPQTKQLALKAGANEFVGKNESPEHLLAAIEAYKDSNKREKGRNLK